MLAVQKMKKGKQTKFPFKELRRRYGERFVWYVLKHIQKSIQV